jgi:hypothetical protein
MMATSRYAPSTACNKMAVSGATGLKNRDRKYAKKSMIHGAAGQD